MHYVGMVQTGFRFGINGRAGQEKLSVEISRKTFSGSVTLADNGADNPKYMYRTM